MPDVDGQVSVIDVGHGSAAVVEHGGWVAIVDAGPGNSLLEFLVQRGVTHVDLILISHADEDHLRGLVGLLSSDVCTVERVRLNSDGLKTSKIWQDVVYLVDEKRRVGAIDVEPTLTPADSGRFDHGSVHVEVVGPSTALALLGPGSRDATGRKITSNSISAVIRISVDGRPLVLFPGDLDEVGLNDLKRVGADVRAPVLVFPHHGGSPGSPKAGEFTTSLCGMVQPETVIFSIGRGVHSTPNPAVVAALRAHGTATRIACTQLSEHCAASVPAAAPSHLNPVFALGREQRKCCGGTITIGLQSPYSVLPSLEQHKDFISRNAPSALCR